MGYDSSRFLGEVDEEFHCSICSMVLDEPVQTPCDHLFCNECITEWLTLNDLCPVDRIFLKTTDLKPCRIIRNVLAKMKINCDFRQQGCKSVIALEHLENHLASCEYNPNSEIICDNGCNLRMKRRENEANNCLMHLSNRIAGQEKKITRLTHELTNQKEQFQRQKEDYDRALNHQKNDIVKLHDEVRSLQEQTEKRPIKWQNVQGITISTDRLNFLPAKGGGCIAQLCYPLDPLNSSFKVEILEKNCNGSIWIKLCSSQFGDENITYGSDGRLYGGILKNRDVPALAVGDIIECGIDHTYNLNSDGSYEVALYFNKNDKLILKELVKMPHDGFYPTIKMYNDCKVKFYN